MGTYPPFTLQARCSHPPIECVVPVRWLVVKRCPCSSPAVEIPSFEIECTAVCEEIRTINPFPAKSIFSVTIFFFTISIYLLVHVYMRKFPEFHVTNSFIERLTSQFVRVHDKSRKICHAQRLAVVSKLLQSRPRWRHPSALGQIMCNAYPFYVYKVLR